MDWKVGVAIVACLGIIAVLLITGGFFNNLMPSSSGLIIAKDSNSKDVANEITMKSTFDMIDFDFIAPADSMELEADKTRSRIFIGNQMLDLSELEKTKIKIEGFDGKIRLYDGNLDLNGKVEKITLNGITIKANEKNQIILESLKIKTLKASNLILSEVEFDATGSLLVEEEKAKLTLNKEALKISKFKGTMEIFENKIKLDGKAEKISTEGKLKMGFE